jgi:hypothetical protein
MEIVTWFAVGVFVGWLVGEAMLTPNVAATPIAASLALSKAQPLSRAELHAHYRPEPLVGRLLRRRISRP